MMFHKPASQNWLRTVAGTFALVVAVCSAVMCGNVRAATYTSAVAGSWDTPATWGVATTPGGGDDVIINHAVTINNNNENCKTLTINGTGKLDGVFGLTVSQTAVINGRVGSLTSLGFLTITSTTSIGTDTINTNNGDQTYTGAVTLTASTTLGVNSTSNKVLFSSTVDGTAGSEVLSFSGANVTFGGNVGGTQPLDSIASNQTATINCASIKTVHGQNYGQGIILGATTQLQSTTSGAISIVNNGFTGLTFGLTINTAGTTTIFNGGSLGSLTVNNGPVTLNGVTITTTGAQNYTALTFTGLTTLTSGGGINFNSTVDGSLYPLVTNCTGGSTTFNGVVGGTLVPSRLTVSGPAVINTSSITTNFPGFDTGIQTFNGAVTLQQDVTLATNTSVSLNAVNGTGTGTESLTINANATFNGAVGATKPLEFLSVSGTSTIAGVTISTSSPGTGNQTYSGAVTLSGSATLNAGSGVILFSSTVNGVANNSQALTLSCGTGTFTNPVGQTFSLSNLVINAGTVTNNTTVTIAGTLSGAGTFTQGASQTFNLGSATGNLVATAAGNTVNYTGAAPTIASAAGGYVNLTLSGSGSTSIPSATIAGTLTVGGSVIATSTDGASYSDVVVSGTGQFRAGGTSLSVANVTIGSGTSFADLVATVSVSGDWTNNGGTHTSSGGVTFNGTTQKIKGTAASEVFNNLTVNTGSTLTTAGSIAAVQATTDLTVNTGGSFTLPATTTITRNLVNAGTITAGTGTINIGNTNSTWDNTGGTFAAGTGTVNLLGVNHLFVGDTSFYNLSDTVGGSALTFTKATTQTVTNTLTLTGALSNSITLRSSQKNQSWNLVLSSAQTASFVDVKDSNASGSTIVATSSTNSGGNSANWVFGIQGAVSWTGTSNTNWGKASNWSSGVVPDFTADVTIPGALGTYPILDQDRSVKSLTINSGASVDDANQGYNLNIVGTASTLVNAGQVLGTTTVVFPGTIVSNLGGSWAAGTSLLLQGAAAQTLQGGGSFAAITLNNAAGASLSGITLNAGAITVQTGTFDTNSNAATCSSLTVTGGTFKALSNNLTVTGNVDINTSGNLIAPTSAFSMKVGGNWSFAGSGTFTNNSGKVIFNGGSPQTLNSGGKTFFDLDVQSAGGLTLSAAVNSAGTLSQTSGSFSAGANAITAKNVSIVLGTFTAPSAGASFTVSGNWVYTAGTFSHNNGKVTFNGGAAQTLNSGGQAFFDLDVQSAGLALQSTGVTSAGTFSQTSGLFTAGARTVTAKNVTIAGGTLTAPNVGVSFLVSGNWTYTGGAFAANSGMVTFNGGTAQTLNSGGQSFFDLDVQSTGGLSLLTTGVTIAGTLSQTSGAFTPGAQSITTKNVSITGGTFTAPPAGTSFTVSGNWSRTPTGIFTHNSGKVTFNGGAAQTLNSGGQTFFDLDNQNTVGGLSLLTTGLTSTGTFTQTSGSFTAGALAITAKNVAIAGGTFTAPPTGTSFTVSGNWTYSAGTFTANGGKVTFNGGAAQTLNSGGQAFFDFDNQSTGGLSLLTTGVTSTGTFSQSSGTFSGGALSITANNVTITGGTLTAPNSTGSFTVSGNWSRSGGAFTANGGKVTFNGGAAQSLNSGGQSFFDIDNQSTGLGLVTNALALAGTFKQTSGAFTAGGLAVSFNNLTLAGGNFTAPGFGVSFTVSGNWSRTGGSFTANGGKVTFNGTTQSLTSGGEHFFDLRNQASTSLTLADALTCDGALSATGLTILNGATVSTAAGQTYAAVTVGSASTLSDSGGTAITFGGAVDGSNSLIVTTTGAVNINSTIGNTTPLTSLTITGGGATTAVTTATVKTSGAQNFNNALTVAAATTTFTGSTVSFASTLDGSAAGMVVAITGGASFGGLVGGTTPLSSLSVSVATAINTTAISTTGDQTYTGAVTLGANPTLTSSTGNVIFSSTIDGARSLTLNATTATKGVTLGGIVGATPLTNLTVNASKILTLGFNVSVTTTLTLNVTVGGVNQTGGIVTATNLLLTGAGTMTLTKSNAIGTLAANINGALSVFNGSALTVGTVGATSGIKTSGKNVSVSALPNTLTVSNTIDTTPVGPPNGISFVGTNVSPSSPSLTLGQGNIALNDDGLGPTVAITTPGQANPTNNGTIVFTVTFNKAVTGFTSSSVTTTNGTVQTITGGPSVYVVTVTGATSNPATNVTLQVKSGAGGSGVTDAQGTANTLASNTGTVLFDTVPPTVLTVTRVNSSPTNLAAVQYTVVFSKSVLNVVAADFTIPSAPLAGSLFPIAGFSVSNVSGSGTTYTITLNTGSGDGTLGLNVPAAGTTIVDAAGNAFVTGFTMTFPGTSTYDIVKTKPAIIGITSVAPDGVYNAGDSLVVNVQFTKNVTLTGGNLLIPLDTGVVLSIPPFGPANNVNVTYTVGAQETSASDPSDNLNVAAATVSLGVGAVAGDNVGNSLILTTPMPNFPGKQIKINAAPLLASPLSVAFDPAFATDQIPGVGLPGQTQTFSVSVTDLDLNPPFPVAANVLTYTWDFGDGTTATTTGATNFITHQFAAAGNLTVKVTVNDGRGGAPVISTLGVSINTPPRTDGNGIVLGLNPIGFDTEESFTITTLGMGGLDQDGDALNFAWDFGDGVTASGQTVTHTYPLDSFPKSAFAADGTVQVTATVTITDPVRGPSAGKVVQQVSIKLLNPFGNVVSVVDDITTDNPISNLTIASKGSKGAVRFSITGAVGAVTSTIEPSDGVSPQGTIKGLTFFALFSKPGIFVVKATDSVGNTVRKMVPITLNETLGGERKNIAAFKSDQSFIIGRFAFNKPKSKDSVVFRGRFPLNPSDYPTGTHSFHVGLGNIIISGTVDAKGKGTATSVVDALGVDHGPKAAKLFRFILDVKNQRAVLSTMVTFPNMSQGGFDSSGVVATFGATGKNGALQPLNVQVALLIDQSLSYASLISAGFLAKNGTGRLAGAKR